MIKHHEEKQITSVTFGKEGKGTIAVCSAGHFLVLQELARPIDISTETKEEDRKPLPKVELEFFDTKSIDVMIKVLQRVKDNMQNPYGQLAMAC